MTRDQDTRIRADWKMNYTYQHFWNLRGTAAFWTAIHFGYRIGALLALIAARLKFTPNMVSVVSFLAACIALVPLFFSSWSEWMQGLWLSSFLLLSYCLDCADGLLARGTGQTSSFGAVFDKTIDMSVGVLSSSVVGLAALFGQSLWIPSYWIVFIFPLTLMPKAAFSVVNWLKDAELYQFDRLRVYEPPKSIIAKLKRLVGNLTDDVAFRVGIGLAWALGAYWEFALLFHGFFLLLLFGYLVKTKRDFDFYDRKKKPQVNIETSI